MRPTLSILLLLFQGCGATITETEFIHEQVRLTCEFSPSCEDSSYYGYTFDECMEASAPYTDEYISQIESGNMLVCFDSEIANQCLSELGALSGVECQSISQIDTDSCNDVWQLYVDVNSQQLEARCDDWEQE